MKTIRRHDIDWLRVIAIWLLLIYHIAIIFQPWAMLFGFIRSDELMENLWKPMTMLNVWRIPILFYISGMGVFFALKKRNWKQLIIERAKRILIPFIFGFLAITPLHMYIFQKYYNMPLSYFPHAGHLWFLGNIFAYVLILSPLLLYLKNNEEGVFAKKLSAYLRNPFGILSIVLFFVIEVLMVKPAMFELYAETMHGFFLGFLAFFFGFLLMYIGKKSWENLMKWRWLYTGVAFILFLLRTTFFEANLPSYIVAIESNFWIFGLFGIGHKYLNHPGKVLTYLSQAAYPIYIIHMFVLYGGSLIILPLQIPVLLKFILIVVFTFTVCYLIYEYIIKRIRIFRPLFGLKWNSLKILNEKNSELVKSNTEKRNIINPEQI
ncbi:MAG: acyltransferase family protein [Balneolaceae bacterium]